MPEKIVRTNPQSPTILTRLNYTRPTAERPRFYANDSSRNAISRDRRTIQVEDARLRAQPPSLAQEGFALFPHESAVADFRDPAQLSGIYGPEIERLVTQVCGADQVVICGPVVLRLKEQPPDWSRRNILRPARFVHVDISDSTAAARTERWRPKDNDRSVRRFAYYNVWRALSPPPQDIPLAVCDARTVSHSDLADADSILDTPGEPESSAVVVVVRYNPRHRWSYFPDMSRDEVLVFKSYDSDPGQPCQVPHSAFKDPSCPPGVEHRTSVEMRAVAFWFGS